MSEHAAAIQTGRLDLRPVSGADLADLQALKADPRAFALMLGGVRHPTQTAEELAEDIGFWARHGVGIWTLRLRADGRFAGIAGIMRRDDGLGMALRFALWPELRGQGLAREAAGAALRFAHDRAGLPRVVAVARADNFASRTVLGSIGMRPCGGFTRDGEAMLIYESLAAA